MNRSSPDAFSGEPVFDEVAALAQAEGDGEFLRELMQIFLDHSPHMLAHIQDAVIRRDAAALTSAAHSFKGSVANFFAAQAVDLSLTLQQRGQANDFSDVDELFLQLRVVATRLETSLMEFLGTAPGGDHRPSVGTRPASIRGGNQ